MKARKINNLTKVMALMKQGKKAQEISKELGMSISNTYNYMTRARKVDGDIKPTRKYIKRKDSNTLAVSARPSYILQLENRVSELAAHNSQLQAELIHAQAELFDKKAVIAYLEGRIK